MARQAGDIPTTRQTGEGEREEFDFEYANRMSSYGTHKGNPKCVCTDGRETERDITEYCNAAPLGFCPLCGENTGLDVLENSSCDARHRPERAR